MTDLDAAASALPAALSRPDLLDGPLAEELDGIVRLASFISGTPAAIRVVDGTRQRTLASSTGGRADIPREDGICARVVATREPLVVPDLAQDSGLARSPSVDGRRDRLRFYAGVPLTASDGHVVGTLCAYDRTPRVLDAERLRLLQELARQAVSRLQAHRSGDRRAAVPEEGPGGGRDAEAGGRDRLTGLADRRGLLAAITSELRLDPDRADVVVLSVGLSGVSTAAGVFGPEAGDAVLVEAARRLRASVRAPDVVARTGEEEFAVLCTRAHTLDDTLVARVRAGVGEVPVPVPGAELAVTACVGIARSRPGLGPSFLLEEAEHDRQRDTADRHRAPASAW